MQCTRGQAKHSPSYVGGAQTHASSLRTPCSPSALSNSQATSTHLASRHLLFLSSACLFLCCIASHSSFCSSVGCLPFSCCSVRRAAAASSCLPPEPCFLVPNRDAKKDFLPLPIDTLPRYTVSTSRKLQHNLAERFASAHYSPASYNKSFGWLVVRDQVCSGVFIGDY